MNLYFILFAAGIFTILLPCILPLVPIVVGASIAGRSRLRPLLITAGMVCSFVGFTFFLVLVLTKFVIAADYIRIATYYILLLFGASFLTSRKSIQGIIAVAGAFFFVQKDSIAVIIAAIVGLLLLSIGGEIAVAMQRFGGTAQSKARDELGEESLFTAFIIGLTLGLVWVPCAGPALGFAFTLVREQPGLQAFLALCLYGAGAALPLLLVGYGGQWALRSARSLSAYSGHIKRISGALLIVSSLALQFYWFRSAEAWLVQNTTYGTLGTRIEEKLFSDTVSQIKQATLPKPVQKTTAEALPDTPAIEAPVLSSGLPILVKAPELVGLGPWHNSEEFTLADVRGKVVLLDIWTYSCINCRRTLPYLSEWWQKYGGDNFAILGVHTPEFSFEKDEANVAEALERLEILYPVAQDNTYSTWNAYNNRYWPALYVLDVDGNIRYMHFGEGKYAETENAIGKLLEEAGLLLQPLELVESQTSSGAVKVVDYKLGAKNWSMLGNATGLPGNEIETYTLPVNIQKNKYYLGGNWQMLAGERQVLQSTEGRISFSFEGSAASIVLGIEEHSSTEYVQVDVFVDGQKEKTFTYSFPTVYPLFEGAFGEHEVELRLRGAGAAAYALMFEE